MATTKRIECDVKDLNLAPKGKTRIEWANQWMPVLALIRKRFIKERPLAGVRVAACLHVTTETANLAITLRDAGAEVVVCASNPLSTQDDVAASLVADSGIPVFATKGEDESTYYSHILAALEFHPQITLDGGADLVTRVLTKRQELEPGRKLNQSLPHARARSHYGRIPSDGDERGRQNRRRLHHPDWRQGRHHRRAP